MRYDEDRDPPIRHNPTFPATVKTAGIIWIVFGSLILLNLLVVLVIVIGGALTVPPQQDVIVPGVIGTLSIGAFMGLFGGGFLYVGVQSVRGTATDTLGNGIGSFVIGMLHVGIGAPLMNSERIPMIAGGVSCLVGLGLILAGILALVGRGPYRDWCGVNLPQRRLPSLGDYDDWRHRPRSRDEDGYHPDRRPRHDKDDRFSE